MDWRQLPAQPGEGPGASRPMGHVPPDKEASNSPPSLTAALGRRCEHETISFSLGIPTTWERRASEVSLIEHNT